MEGSPLVVLCVLPELPARLLAAELGEAGLCAHRVAGPAEAEAALDAATGKVALVVEAGTLHASASWRALLDARPEAALVVVSTASPATPEEELVAERRGALVRDPLDLWAVEGAVRRVLGLPRRPGRPRRAGPDAGRSPKRSAGTQ